MSIKVQSYVWENSTAKGSQLLLLLAIADHAHDDGEGAYPSVETLAKKCRQTERNTQLLLRELEEKGEIVTRKQSGPHGCNIYIIPVPWNSETWGEKFSGVKTSAEGVKTSVKNVHQISPEPSLTIIEPSLSKGEPQKSERQEALETMQTAFEKCGGYLNPTMIQRFYAAYDANSDNRPARLEHAVLKLQTDRNFFRAVDAYMQWKPPELKPQYSQKREQFTRPKPQAAEWQPPTPDEIARFRAERAAMRGAD